MTQTAKSRTSILLLAALLLSGCAPIAVGGGPSQLPPDKQAREDRYASDRATGRAREPRRGEDPAAPGPEASEEGTSAFPTRPAGNGTIVETGEQGPEPSTYAWRNEWFIRTRSQVISVYAGALRADPSQGVLLVSVFDASEAHLLRSVVLKGPGRAGALRFVGGVGDRASLAASDGTGLEFDPATLGLRRRP
jgi:hypothetical protein